MLRLRAVLGAACAMSAQCFLPSPNTRVCRSSTALQMVAPGLQKAEKMPIAWEEDKTHRVNEEDRFVLRPDIKDYAKLEVDELRETEKDGAVKVAKEHKTFIPADHPFAHARFLNVVARVKNVDQTVQFYQSIGFIPLREKSSAQYSSVVVGFGSEEYGQNAAIQFVQEGGKSAATSSEGTTGIGGAAEVGGGGGDNDYSENPPGGEDQAAYVRRRSAAVAATVGAGPGEAAPVDVGDGYLGAAVVVNNLQEVLEKAKGAGGSVVKGPETVEFPATQVPDQDAQTMNKETRAIVTDPDGYRVTLIEGESKQKLQSLILRVFDLEKAIEFYGKLGMKVLKKRANTPVETSSSAWIGYDDDHVYTMGFVHEKLPQAQFHVFKAPTVTLELKYEYDSKPVKQGSFAQLVVGVNRGVKTAFDAISSAGGKTVKDPSTEDGQDVAAVQDLDGYTVTLVDMEQFNEMLV